MFTYISMTAPRNNDRISYNTTKKNKVWTLFLVRYLLSSICPPVRSHDISSIPRRANMERPCRSKKRKAPAQQSHHRSCLHPRRIPHTRKPIRATSPHRAQKESPHSAPPGSVPNSPSAASLLLPADDDPQSYPVPCRWPWRQGRGRVTTMVEESVGVDGSGGVVRPTAAIFSEWMSSRPRSTSARRCSTLLSSAVVAPSAPRQITVCAHAPPRATSPLPITP
jgi:hypothetical protein